MEHAAYVQNTNGVEETPSDDRCTSLDTSIFVRNDIDVGRCTAFKSENTSIVLKLMKEKSNLKNLVLQVCSNLLKMISKYSSCKYIVCYEACFVNVVMH